MVTDSQEVRSENTDRSLQKCRVAPVSSIQFDVGTVVVRASNVSAARAPCFQIGLSLSIFLGRFSGCKTQQSSSSRDVPGCLEQLPLRFLLLEFCFCFC